MDARIIDAHAAPSFSLQLWSVLLPLIKCAVCPACLSIFGGLFVGARLGFLGSERVHLGIIALSVTAEFFILRAAAKHHQSKWPLRFCIAGAALAFLGHATVELVEYAGFSLLLLSAVQNLVLLRRHRKSGAACCAHDADGPLAH